jgi:hypothetical protein
LVDPAADAQDLPHDQQPDIAQPGDSSVTLSVSSDSANSSDGSVNGLQPNGNLFVQHNLQVGLVLTPEIVLPESHFGREGSAAWTKHFCSSGRSAPVSVPIGWAGFLTARLLSQDDFSWSKSLLQSKVWPIICDTEQSFESSRSLSLPLACPGSAL